MDYIHFKKRIIVNTQYSMIFFSADIDIGSEVYVSMFNLNGIYIACIIGNNTEIETIIRTLESKHLTSNIYGLSIFDIKASLDNSEHIIPDMSIISDFEMNLGLNNSKRITLNELNSLLDIDTKSKTCISKPLKVDIESFCEVLAEIYVPPPIKEMSVNVELDFNLIIESNVADSKPLLVSMPFAFLHEASMNIDDSVLVSSEITDSILLTISIINDTPIAILSSLSGQAAFSMNSSIKTSRSLKTNIVQNGLVSAIMRLMEGALLSDYDLLSLSDLDNLTLFEIDYIGE